MIKIISNTFSVLIGIVAFSAAAIDANAQIVTGPASANQTATSSYTLYSTTAISNTSWEVTGGNTISAFPSSDNQNFKCQINWTTSGTFTITFKQGVTVVATKSVSVICAPPSPTLTSAQPVYGSGRVSMIAGFAESYTGAYNFHWYSAASGGTLLGTGHTYTSPLITTTTSYYVAAYEPTGLCESSRVLVTASVYPIYSPNQTITEFVRVKDVKNDADILALTEATQRRTIQTHYDGLMRPTQQVAIKATPAGKDVVQAIEYNQAGLQGKTYLPYVAHNTFGTFNGKFVDTLLNFYSKANDRVENDTKPYAAAVIEASPLNRAKKIGQVGDGFQPGQGHDTRLEYLLNDASEVRKLKSDGSSTGYWAANQLDKTKTTDPEGRHVLVYSNQLGQTVMQRQQLGEVIDAVTVNYLDTYYVYDDQGRPKYTITPKGVKELAANSWSLSSPILDNYVYQFVYDKRGRVIEKKVPGQAWLYFIYDDLNRLVLTQDGLLRAQNKWLFIKYDYQGRAIISGLYLNASQITRSAVQTIADGLYTSGNATYGVNTWYESRGTTLHGYSNISFPKINADNSALEILSVNYFDDHDFDYNGTADYTYTVQSLTNENTPGRAHGLNTGSKRLVLGTTNWLYTYVFYDEYARPIQVRTNNHLNSGSINNLKTTVYLFDGTITTVKTYQDAGSGNITTVVNEFEYDNQGRLKKVKQKNNSDAQVTLVKNTYNELGELVEKGLHNTSAENYLQSLDYRYTIRGQLKSINNAQLTNDGALNDDTNDVFGMELLYDQVESGLNTARYDGNISGVKWKGAGAASGATDQKSYTYAYDNSDKLKSSTSKMKGVSLWDKEVNVHNEALTYDHNGNIKTLQRNQRKHQLAGIIASYTSEAMDNMTYTYGSPNGNSLEKITDAVSGSAGFDNGSSGSSTDYAYDTNGNLTSDKNKGIDSVKYNFLGRPIRVKFSSGKLITYVYDAGGNKLRMSVTESSTTTTTDYIKSFVYTNNALSFFKSPAGRVVKKGGNLEYEYSIADHQGNTRVLFTSSTPAAEATTVNFETSTNNNVLNYTRTNFELFDHTDVSGSAYTYSQKLTGASNSQVGIAKTIKVYPGDKVKLEAYAKYYNPSGTSSNLTGFAMALTGAFGVNSSSTGEALKAYNSLNNYGGIIAGGGGSGSSSHPKLFINILLFDKDYNLLDAAWEQIDGGEQVGATPKAAHDYMSKEVTVKEAGFAYVYVSNENPTLVEFYVDDVVITHTPTNVIQYNEYYSFGLQASSSWTRENNSNSHLYNAGTEFNRDNGWYEMLFRDYDPVIARFSQIDPMSFEEKATYQYAANNPLRFNDPSGLYKTDWIIIIIYIIPAVDNGNGAYDRSGENDSPDGYGDWLQKRMAKLKDYFGGVDFTLGGGGAGGGYASKHPKAFTDGISKLTGDKDTKGLYTPRGTATVGAALAELISRPRKPVSQVEDDQPKTKFDFQILWYSPSFQLTNNGSDMNRFVSGAQISGADPMAYFGNVVPQETLRSSNIQLFLQTFFPDYDDERLELGK